MIKHTINKSVHVIYQKCEDDCGFPEPAIIVTEYESDIVGIESENGEVLINRDSIKEFIDVLKKHQIKK